jgi:tyrosyl-tRNA synthetase
MKKDSLGLIQRNCEEIVTLDELKEVLKKKSPVVYCGYEPSGPMHLGHFVTILKLKDCANAGCKVKVLLADVHAMLNRKGDSKLISKEVEAWRKTVKSIDSSFEIVLGSDFQFSKEYQFDVMSISQDTTVNRGMRSMQEVARDIRNATISQLWYPLMQVVDIKHLGVDIAVGGLEQRKVHMIGKENASKMEHKFVALHTPLITSLKGPGKKMSKSIPGSGISVTDSYDVVKKTLKEAYCPEKEVKDNPVLQICKLIVFPVSENLKIKRPEKFGGDKNYKEYSSLENDFFEGKLHPLDLKNAVADAIEEIIGPIRNNFLK